MHNSSNAQPDLTTLSATGLRFQAVLQRANLQAASVAIAHAPSADDCAAAIERARQHLEHLEYSLDLYRERFGGELAQEIALAAASLPTPTGWLEANVAQLVLSQASQAEARGWLEPQRPSRTLLRQLAESAEHVVAARAALRDLCASEPELASQIPLLAGRWLGGALASLNPATQDACRAGILAATTS